jgi:hypothetical protein
MMLSMTHCFPALRLLGMRTSSYKRYPTINAGAIYSRLVSHDSKMQSDETFSHEAEVNFGEKGEAEEIAEKS